MKEQDSIPTGKVQRATRFVSTGAKIGGNYLKFYTKKIITGDSSRAELDESNAEDIYNSLSELKGSALKVAQMLSMDQGLLPGAYTQKFSQAQYNAPPLSYPLVVKTFKQELGGSPESIFESFGKTASAAASIGQVHKAEKDGQAYAVKIQYPGVGESIRSDLKLVKPIAMRMFNLSEADITHYLEEVEERLIEECDYGLELQRSIEIGKACAHLKNIQFPVYKAEMSGRKILTMEWLEGKHLIQFLKNNPSQEVKNKIGQSLWDFYDFQIHELLQVHADPHPGNFLFREDGTMGVIDFGCIKTLTPEFYKSYFRLLDVDDLGEPEDYDQLLRELKYLLKEDSTEDAAYFKEKILMMNQLLGLPFRSTSFDFGDPSYFAKIYAISEELAGDKRLRKANGARGPKDALYINRTYFGLYTLLHNLGAKVEIQMRKASVKEAIA